MKKQTFKLDIEFDSDPFEDLAFLFFHSTDPNYAFADDLNHLYGLALTRVDDMPLLNAAWPVYTYRNTLRQLNYYLIERPVASGNTAPFWGARHKMLLLQGDDATPTADRIYSDFNDLPTPPDPADIHAVERHSILKAFHSSFTPVSLLDPTAPLPPSASRKAKKEHDEMERLFTSILDHFDLSRADMEI